MFSRANAVGLPNRVGGMGSVGAWVAWIKRSRGWRGSIKFWRGWRGSRVFC